LKKLPKKNELSIIVRAKWQFKIKFSSELGLRFVKKYSKRTSQSSGNGEIGKLGNVHKIYLFITLSSFMCSSVSTTLFCGRKYL
jgi:hypothetical protein